jgi:putative mRNA 3-end processing factor
MVGDALQIRLGNGIEISGPMEVRLDPRRLEKGAVNCISHAHSDHLPRSFEDDKAMASRITLRCASERVRRRLEPCECDSIRMLNSGHIPGSTMFMFEGEKKVLYTGDMCPRDRYGSDGARPVKTDILVIESTYGSPRYVFPPTEEMGDIMHDWIGDSLNHGYSVALYAYPLGKSQTLIRMLDDYEPYLQGSVLDMTKMVEDGSESRYRYREYASDAVKEPSVVICPTGARGGMPTHGHGKFRTAAVSGWALDPSYRYAMGTDEAFAISDHADFEELIEFTRACSPSMVFVQHGFDEVLAKEIKKRLGIDARPMRRNQRSLMEF